MTTRGERDRSRQQRRLIGPALGLIVGVISFVSFTVTPGQAGSSVSGHDHSAGTQGRPAWAEQLKGQTIVEDVYVWGNQRLSYSQSGQWGYLRVLPAGDQRILPLAGAALDRQQAAAVSSTQGLTAVSGLK